LYPGTQHGFAVRGDEKDSTVQAAKKAALDEGIAFFKKQLA
jgi:dienelactone hydrolase